MDYGAIIGMIAQLAGSAAGQAASQMDKDAAMKLIQAAVDDMGKINVPKLQNLLLSQQKSTGLAGIKDDPTYRSQQNAADAQLGDIVNSGGLTLADKSALNAIRNRTARTESAGRNAIANDMASRGTLDSGAQLAMQLQGNQQSANSLAQADESAAAQAQARAFQAIKERASLAGQGLDRDYRRQSDAARAQDAINAGNTAIMNTATMHNAGLGQQDFNNQLALANAKAQPGYALAGAYGAQAKDKQQAWQGAGNTYAAGAKAFGQSNSNNNTGGGLGYDDAASGVANSNSFDSGSSAVGGTDWNSYPGNALSGESTRTDGQEIIGYDSAGKPIYGHKQPQGQNF